MTEKFIKLSDFLKMIGKEEETEQTTSPETEAGGESMPLPPEPDSGAPADPAPEEVREEPPAAAKMS
ncbi:MAG: hypothetical protein J5827_03790, partial [Oscillospiraceae bacterium]|nr:hypothetical protein [Oscillospiraceae bacterium]